jgi:acyl-[acyl-carrier-protein]-phospholipid O-acyltransferase/long-chain-fatty-acid--[acyl-carrier-protein] ligase
VNLCAAQDPLLQHRFIRTAKTHPKKTFVVDRTLGRRLTYSRALIASLVLARRFEPYEPGFIGIMLPTSAGCALAILAALMSGRVPVMINYATGAEANAKRAAERCGFRTIVTARALLEKVECPELPGMVFLEDFLREMTLGQKLRATVLSLMPTGWLIGRVAGGSEDDDVLVLFTTGSEKEPKAVELSHRNIASNVDGMCSVFQLSPDDSMLANMPYFHVFGQTVNLWVPVSCGMTMFTHANPLKYRAVVKTIREERPTIVVGTPSFLRGYVAESEPGDFESVRILVGGADTVPNVLRESFREKHGIEICEGYGATETSPVISVNTLDANRPGSVGRPLPGVEVRIVDYQTGEDRAAGESGKILVSGAGVMKGYLNDLEETSKSIRDGWYDTGDMGRIDEDGYVWHEGRLKRFVKVGGEMVSLVRVEGELEELLPDDVVCCVVGIADASRGARIIAAVTSPVDEESIKKELAERLPRIAIPKEFLVVDELPETGSGKTDFRRAGMVVQEILRKRSAEDGGRGAADGG